jgi:hypothetical protein
MMRLRRAVLRIPPPRLTREQAAEIARAECERQGWAWEQPVRIHEHLRYYWFWTNAHMRGGNVHIRVDIHDGRVLWSSITPR